MNKNIMSKFTKCVYYIAVCTIIFFNACNKKKDNLVSISISPNTMVGTPAEMFSLQQIKLFQASNDFLNPLIISTLQDTVHKNLFIAPLYFLNTVMTNSETEQWQKGFCKHYNLTELPIKQRIKTVDDFIKTVYGIDSSITIICTGDFSEQTDSIKIFQSFNLKLNYHDSEPEDIDNIFTTDGNKKPRLDFITINDNIRTLINDNEQVTELSVGNGNYMIMFIKPLSKTISQYIREFSEEKYFNLINNMQERKVKVSYPLIAFKDSISDFTVPSYEYADSLVTFPKPLSICYEFSLSLNDMMDIDKNETGDASNKFLQSNDSKPIKYNSPFIFILRGKSSNLIMFFGVYTGPSEKQTLI